jgi:hypothetical protein
LVFTGENDGLASRRLDAGGAARRDKTGGAVAATVVSPPLRPAVEADDVTGRRALSEVILTPTTAGLLPVAEFFQPMRAVTANQTENPVQPGRTQAETLVTVARGKVIAFEQSQPVTLAGIGVKKR